MPIFIFTMSRRQQIGHFWNGLSDIQNPVITSDNNISFDEDSNQNIVQNEAESLALMDKVFIPCTLGFAAITLCSSFMETQLRKTIVIVVDTFSYFYENSGLSQEIIKIH